MLTNQTLEKMQKLKLTGMCKVYDEHLNMPEITKLSFDDRLGLMVDRELIDRDNRRLTSRLRKAKLKIQACLENIDFKASRGLDKSFVLTLANCNWVTRHQNIIISGATGCGKTYLACALAQKACREGFNAVYFRTDRLFQEITTGRGDGRYLKIIEKLAKADVLILDDWGLSVLTDTQRKDLLEILEDRYNTKSTIVTTQFPVDKWHELIGEPTIADAILDRLVHNAHRIKMKGGSMRKKLNSLPKVSS